MDARLVHLLAQRARVRKADSARAGLIAATLVQHVSILVSMLMVLSYPHPVWLLVPLVPCLWAGVAGGLLQFHLRERLSTVLILGAMMLIPGVSLLVAALMWYDSDPVLALARSLRATMCPQCDYSLKGLSPGTPCPECGWRAAD